MFWAEWCELLGSSLGRILAHDSFPWSFVKVIQLFLLLKPVLQALSVKTKDGIKVRTFNLSLSLRVLGN